MTFLYVLTFSILIYFPRTGNEIKFHTSLVFNTRHWHTGFDVNTEGIAIIFNQGMFTLYWIGFCSVSRVAPVQCEQELMFC